ncbi:uncharacterized protein LOC113472438 [Diaphorina citri]|uniref:Uncharacterized protein LOC113472438 n=1 Tax=Diaphorina citri TaxID=121845 RepID=A0A3Q0JHY5_DIACI|nr:uncharacterized protein LOC113472438 [Diaphorina citri]
MNGHVAITTQLNQHTFLFYFSQQILILITSHFTYIICNIYYVVVIFIEAMNGHVAITKHLSFIFLIVYWCGFKSVHLVWIVYYAAKTQNEGNKTHTHAQERDSQYFGQLLSKQNIHLTVCGLFPLDYTLLYTVRITCKLRILTVQVKQSLYPKTV